MIRVFTYGTLRRGLSNHDLIDGRYSKVKESQVKGFKKITKGCLPYAITAPDSILDGELYEFETDEILSDLDLLEGYNLPGYDYNHYDRITIQDINGLEAYMYVMSETSPTQENENSC